MPQLEQIDTFASQIFWLIVSFGVLYYMMARVVLPRIADIMAEREDRVAQDLARAQTLKLQSEQIMEEYEAALGEARAEAAIALKQATDEVSAEVASRQDEVTAKLNAKAAEAESRIDKAKQEALANVKVVASDVSQAAVGKLLGSAPQPAEVNRAVEQVLGGKG